MTDIKSLAENNSVAGILLNNFQYKGKNPQRVNDRIALIRALFI
jgi:hypothetical protein